MEGKGRQKFIDLNNAIKDFGKAVNFDISGKNEDEIDILWSGQIQKFEFCIELFWKTIKELLNELYLLDVATPKQVVTVFFEQGHCDEQEYKLLVDMLRDRNKLSHIYKLFMAMEIKDKLPVYLKTLEDVVDRLKRNIT